MPTPVPSTPEAVIASIGRLVKRLVKSQGLDETTPVGIGLPGVTLDGTLKFAGNIDQAWIDFPVVERLTKLLKRPIFIINDADAAGIAEMRFGVGKGRPGKVIFLTLGTGVGSGVFNDGVLVPNTEFGQMEIRGPPAERRSAAAARVKRGLSWKAWAHRPRRAPRAHPAADVAQPHDPRRRGQQERRQVHPAADRELRGRARRSCATTRGSSGRRSWRPRARSSRPPTHRPPTQPARSTREAKT